MDNDSYSCLVEFDANYWNLVERCFTTEQPDDSSRSEPCLEPVGTATARPQGSVHTAEHFRAKFEEMEKAFRDEFLSTSHRTAATMDGCRGGDRTRPQVSGARDI